MLVYLPQDPHIGISQRIENEAERESCVGKCSGWCPTENCGGFIIRTMAEDASDHDMQMDIEYLRKLWSTIHAASQNQTAARTAVSGSESGAARAARFRQRGNVAHSVVDSRENFVKLHRIRAQLHASVLTKLVHYTGERPLFDLYGVEEEIQRALGRRVDLKSGGYLIIDQTEAMTTIDVNTGSYVTGRNFDDTIFKTNLEAAQAIARQLRLRNLGGIIILDFIDMENEEHRNAVLAELSKALIRDRTRISTGSPRWAWWK